MNRTRDILIFVLAGALAFSVYRQYEKGNELQQLCDLTAPHDVSVDQPTTPNQKIDSVCSDYQPAD
jgi:hypothetical protein